MSNRDQLILGFPETNSRFPSILLCSESPQLVSAVERDPRSRRSGKLVGVAKGVFGYKFVELCESSYVRCLMLLNCFHTRTMLEIESRCVFRLMWAIM